MEKIIFDALDKTFLVNNTSNYCIPNDRDRLDMSCNYKNNTGENNYNTGWTFHSAVDNRGHMLHRKRKSE